MVIKTKPIKKHGINYMHEKPLTVLYQRILIKKYKKEEKRVKKEKGLKEKRERKKGRRETRGKKGK